MNGDDRSTLGAASETNEGPSHEAPRLRTYAADMSRAIRSRGETLSSIALKERAAEKPAASKRRPSSPSRLFMFGGILFVLLGLGLIAGVFFLTQESATAPELSSSIIFPNETMFIDISDSGALLAELASVRGRSDLTLGEVKRIVLTRGGVPLTPQETADALGLPGPLSREAADIMLGIHAFDRNQPFIILSVATYDRSLSALLSWEKEMGRDLGEFFKPTSGALPAPTLAFADDVVRNVDVRKSQSAWPILYAYPARTLVVITTNDFTLREVITRLGSARQEL